MRTQERYNDGIRTTTTRFSPFTKYSNFQDATLDPSSGLLHMYIIYVYIMYVYNVYYTLCILNLVYIYYYNI